MDDVAIGRVLRSIRVRLRLRQVDVAVRAGLSQQLVSVLELGALEHVSIPALRRIGRALGAEIVITVRWRGADVDRLRDEDHARTVGEVAQLLEREGWLVRTEVTYNEYGERGSIDVLAFHPGTSTLLVIEVKTQLVSLEETLRRLDQKVRLAPRIARVQFGWTVSRASSMLTLLDSRTNRRRVARHDPVLGRAAPVARRRCSILASIAGRGGTTAHLCVTDQCEWCSTRAGQRPPRGATPGATHRARTQVHVTPAGDTYPPCWCSRIALRPITSTSGA